MISVVPLERYESCSSIVISLGPRRTDAAASGYNMCSCSRIRAESISTVSAARTGTVRWAMIGPPSNVLSTKWTVHPLSFTRCSRPGAARQAEETTAAGWGGC